MALRGRSASGAAAGGRFVRAPSALWRSGEFGVVVLPAGAADPVTLSGSGAAMWDELATARSLEELSRTLAARYRAPVEVVASDLAAGIEVLCELGAIDEADG